MSERECYRLLSWNVAGRAGRLKDQVEAILEVSPDIVALQEVTLKTAPHFRSLFLASGYGFVVDSFQLSADLGVLKGPPRYGQLIASRLSVTPLDPKGFQVPWPEHILSAVVYLPGKDIGLHAEFQPSA